MTPFPHALDFDALYHAVLEAWNARDASRFAELFFEQAHLTGFDGSMLEGRAEIASSFARIFRSHSTPTYVGKVRSAIRLTEDVMMIRAVAGMVPPGHSDINPELNAVQSVIAVRREGRWRVAAFHNTPAAFHEQPETRDHLTSELRALLGKRS